MYRDEKSTATTRARYDRRANLYDLMEFLPERSFKRWREKLWKAVKGQQALELGVGTGKNMPYYPLDMELTAVDLSPAMLQKARERVARDRIKVDLQEADAQAMPFPDGSFDTVAATFVFCSVPDPMLGLAEAKRVLRPGGQLILIEHVLSRRQLLRIMMNLINPVAVRAMGANINRETVENVRRAGFADVRAEPLYGDIVYLIEACVEEDITLDVLPSRAARSTAFVRAQ